MSSEDAVVTRFIRKMGGSSQPFLAEASDGKRYVVKYAQEGCANFLFNESLGSNLYQLFGLLCPAWKPLIVTDEFLDENIGCWIERDGRTGFPRRTRPPSGLCFGSQFLGDAETETYQMLPGSWFKRVHRPFDFWRAWFLDICAEHYDTRQALFHERPDRLIQPFFIDHGFMFGGPENRFSGKVMAPRYLDSRVYNETPLKILSRLVEAAQSVHEEEFWLLLDTIPVDWKTPKAMAAFARFIGRILDKDLTAVIIQRMDTINQVFLRFRSDGKPAWRAHCYGHFFPSEIDELDGRIESQTALLD